MDTATRNAICRIDAVIPPRGAARGTGSLIAPDLVLTAFHVVGDRTSAPPSFYEEITLSFPGFSRAGTVVDAAHDAALDFAIVRLSEPAPRDVVPLALRELEEGGEHAFRSFGFPEAHADGLAISGTVEMVETTYEDSPALQLFSIQAAAGIGMQTEGLSGGPCVVDGEVAGVIRANPRRVADGKRVNVGGTLFACSIKHVLEKTNMVRPSLRGRDLPPIANDLPANPFRYLAPYGPEDAEIFFGRDEEIRRLVAFVTSPSGNPICLLRGPTGVGKTSLLSAGLIPRIQPICHVVHRPRGASLDLLSTLLGALEPETSAPDRDVLAAWKHAEATRGKPLVVILDQLEEAYTRAGGRGDAEVIELARAVRAVFHDRATRPAGRLILSFRKEWTDDVERAIEPFALPYVRQYVAALDRTGILQTMVGLRRTARLRDHFKVDIPKDLPGHVADELLRDQESSVAPMLQILLTRMWEKAKKAARADRVVFSVELFDELRKKELRLEDFVQRQIEALPAEHRPHVQSGLLWDLLEAHTTPLGTSQALSRHDLEQRYSHVRDAAAALADELTRRFLLGGWEDPSSEAEAPKRRGTRLMHDTLGPVVRKGFAASDAPGQIARTLLEARAREWVGEKTGPALSRADLRRALAGLRGMRAPTQEEDKLLHSSRVRLRLIQAASILGAAGALVLLGALAKQRWDVQEREREAQQASAALKATLSAADARRHHDLSYQTVDPVEALVHVCRAVDAAPEDDPLLSVYVNRAIHAFVEAPVASVRLPQTVVDIADADEALSHVAWRAGYDLIQVQRIDLSDPVAGGGSEPLQPLAPGENEHISESRIAWSPDGRHLLAHLFGNPDEEGVSFAGGAIFELASRRIIERFPSDWIHETIGSDRRDQIFVRPRRRGDDAKSEQKAEQGARTPEKYGFRVVTDEKAVSFTSPPPPYVSISYGELPGGGSARVHGITRGGRVDRYQPPAFRVYETGLAELRFARMSDRISVAGGGRAKVLTVAAPPSTLWEGEAAGLAEVAMSPSGDRIAVASHDRKTDQTVIRVLDGAGSVVGELATPGRLTWLTWNTEPPRRLVWSRSRMDGSQCWQSTGSWVPGWKTVGQGAPVGSTVSASDYARFDGQCREDFCGGTSPEQGVPVPARNGLTIWASMSLRLERDSSALFTTQLREYDSTARLAIAALLQTPSVTIAESGLMVEGAADPPFEIHSTEGYAEVLMGEKRESPRAPANLSPGFCLPRIDPTGSIAAWWSPEKLSITVISTGTTLTEIILPNILEYGFLDGGRQLLMATKDGKIRTTFVHEPYTKKPAWVPLLGQLVSGQLIDENGNRVAVPGMLHGEERKKAFDTLCAAAKAGDRGAVHVVRHVNAARKKGPYCDLPE